MPINMNYPVCVSIYGNGLHYATVVTTSFDLYHDIELLIRGEGSLMNSE